MIYLRLSLLYCVRASDYTTYKAIAKAMENEPSCFDYPPRFSVE
jgi:hypothetical protein